MNSGALLNRMEILLYSTLTSAMSGLSHIRAHFQRPDEIHTCISPNIALEPSQPIVREKDNISPISWDSITEILLTILLWVILGFATGFMLGMIRPG